MLMARGELDDAEEQCRAGLKQNEAHADLHFGLGQIDRRRKRLDSAREHLERTLQSDPAHRVRRDCLSVGVALPSTSRNLARVFGTLR